MIKTENVFSTTEVKSVFEGPYGRIGAHFAGIGRKVVGAADFDKLLSELSTKMGAQHFHHTIMECFCAGLVIGGSSLAVSGSAVVGTLPNSALDPARSAGAAPAVAASTPNVTATTPAPAGTVATFIDVVKACKLPTDSTIRRVLSEIYAGSQFSVQAGLRELWHDGLVLEGLADFAKAQNWGEHGPQRGLVYRMRQQRIDGILAASK